MKWGVSTCSKGKYHLVALKDHVIPVFHLRAFQKKNRNVLGFWKDNETHQDSLFGRNKLK
jgi:hypothetical protein